MKKIILLAAVMLPLMSVFLLSCGKTTDKIVKDAFDSYVELNFDDPSAVKEVVSVTYGDTLTRQSLAELLSDMSEMADSLNRECNTMTDKANMLANKYGYKFRRNPSFRKDWTEYERALEDRLEKLWEVVTPMLADDSFLSVTKDSLLKCQDFTLLNFTISYRVKEGQGLKMKEKQGYIDMNTSDVYFGDSKEETKNAELQNLLKGVLETEEIYLLMIKSSSDVIEKAQKIISYF